uniref:Putative LOV domain-containing protein n=1 Tax=Loeskeobryum brevirostre TaxID=94452 RepID=A0A126X3F8_9BRYO|nr:putative LOV domain-containing protein [Loeskeobryum brevirostre]
MSFTLTMGTDTPRCTPGRVSNRNKGSLEVFGGAPRLLQAGVFAQAPPVTSHEEDTPRSRSSLFESMMIDSTTASSLGRSLERSSSERTSGTQNSSQAMADRGQKKDWNALAAPPIRRYSLEEGKADPVYSGYQQSLGMISTEVQRALSTFQQAFVVTDATQPDCPIMFASACFLAMTGYSHGEVIGRNCRFLQGPGTDCNEVARIREALRCGSNFSGRLLNYKKNGRPFWNLLTITPIRDAHDRVIMCIGMQAEVSKHTEGCRENALRPNGLSASLIRYESRQLDQATDAMTEIVGAFRKTSLSVEPQADVDVDKGHHPKPLTPSRNSNYHNFGHNLQRGHSSNQSKWDSRRDSKAAEPCPSPSIIPQPRKKRRISKFMSFLGFSTKCSSSQRREDHENAIELRMPSSDDDEDEDRAQVIRRAFDLATSLERIEKNFVITDPRLPDNPIIFASDQFLELTEYTREDVLGCNCRFLQGPETDPATVRQIKDAIAECRDITVQLVNYTKSGRPFWNLFHLQAVRDPKGELQYFIGVQQNPQGRLSDHTERERAKMVQQTATTIDDAVRELPDANLSPERLWALHSQPVFPKPRTLGSPAWKEILKARSNGDKLGLKSFRPIKPLGCGDTGR